MMAKGSTSSPPAFEIGLVMAGAVSAGAYTAGVMDYLLEVLETWEHARQQGLQVPQHRVVIKVMAGASAGGMTSALAAVQMLSKGREGNSLLYDCWVKKVDILHLLGTSDLQEGEPIRSLLDANVVQNIAHEAISQENPPQWVDVPWIEKDLKIYLTLSNLRGLPYGIDMEGPTGLAHGMTDHADYEFVRVGPEMSPIDWKRLRDAAVATGAFPIGLEARMMSRPLEDYKERMFKDGRWISGFLKLDPKIADPYTFLAVDGGMLNNEPMELARSVWSEKPKSEEKIQDYSQLDDHSIEDDRKGQGKRAILMIDPFPDPPAMPPAPGNSTPGIFGLLAPILGALRSQSLFKVEELIRATREDDLTRYLIAPIRKESNGQHAENALASGFLMGFGGFMSEEFREHDYHLGRRNCQQFLRKHFAIPEELARQSPCFKDTLDERYFFEDKDGGIYYPVIPIIQGEKVEKEQGMGNPWPVFRKADMEKLASGSKKRVHRIFRQLVPISKADGLGIYMFISLAFLLIMGGEYLKVYWPTCGCGPDFGGMMLVYIVLFQLILLIPALGLFALGLSARYLRRKAHKGFVKLVLSHAKDWGLPIEKHAT
jgi:hypothetical protein